MVSAPSPRCKSGSRTKDKPAAEKEKDIRIVNYGIRFDGLGNVDAPELVVTAVMEGVGPGRFYGRGVLSLAPARGTVAEETSKVPGHR
ncbi:type I-E CRISPR-associated protein Cas6/Cse3/CasE [Nocardiopsis baichengensis]|uniref:type I-E CRISPR-associated protein Cas6/Cse3/CasE n=1 Tax=Nocardiopsis baichengensis TaxID=280240 RepID=UPI001267C281